MNKVKVKVDKDEFGRAVAYALKNGLSEIKGVYVMAELLPDPVRCTCHDSTEGLTTNTPYCPVHDVDPVAEGECCKTCWIKNSDYRRGGFCEAPTCSCHIPKEEKCDCGPFTNGNHRWWCGSKSKFFSSIEAPIQEIEELGEKDCRRNDGQACLSCVAYKLNEVIEAFNRLAGK